MDDLLLSWIVLQVLGWIGGFIIFVIINPDKDPVRKERYKAWVLITGFMLGWISTAFMIMTVVKALTGW
jgi:hypothetical protein